MTDSNRELPSREYYPVDTAAIAAIGRFRLLGALACTASGVWIAFLGPELLGWTVAVLAWAISFFWMAAYLGSRRSVRREASQGLILDAEEVRWSHRGAPHSVNWADVESLEVDEDRLVLVVRTTDGTSKSIEPLYRGLSLYDMANRLQEHHGASQSRNRH